MTDFFELGRILKPQGVKGELKISAYTDDLARFLELQYFYFKEGDVYTKMQVEKARVDAKFAYLQIEHIEDRNQAERLRGRYIYIDRANAAKLPPGRYYISDLMGMCVMDNHSEELGTLTDILQTGSRDVYVVALKQNGTLMFPSVDGVILERDVEQATMTVDADKLAEVGIYDL